MTAKRLALPMMMMMIVLLLAAATAHAAPPGTINNDDSCDVGTYPAATLLLPYFEVDFNSPQTTARTTLFTVTNTSRLPQVAHVTLWTDWDYPVLNFNLFLTGYDVQAINLYDVIARGVIGSTYIGDQRGSAGPIGPLSAPNAGNPGFASTVLSDCAYLPGYIPPQLIADTRSAFTTGAVSSCTARDRVGSPHANAVGYATIDVTATCTPRTVTAEAYFTKDLLFDNVLTGDYMIIDPNPATGNYASGNPLVHIRAIPEGGAAGAVQATNLPYTFYDRYTPRQSQAMDRRQPLPSTFSARFIDGGTGNFNTKLTMWREGKTGSGALCTEYAPRNRDLIAAGEIVRFDEHENFQTFNPGVTIGFPSPPLTIPVASSQPTSSSTFPPAMTASGDVGGWLYLNLTNDGSPLYSVGAGHDAAKYKSGSGPRQSQNWVTVRMAAQGRYAVEYDATSLGNGCSPAPPASSANYGTVPIGPLPNANP